MNEGEKLPSTEEMLREAEVYKKQLKLKTDKSRGLLSDYSDEAVRFRLIRRISGHLFLK